jgi:glycosyltransferase involved in cell wall biosynthesis
MVIHGGVDVDRYAELARADTRDIRHELGLTDASAVVGIVANSRPLKDLATFLRAAASVVEVAPGTRFVIIGEGWQRDKLVRLARELHLDGNVLFLGLRRDVPRIVSILDIGVCSSLSESCCNAILEYMASRKPVVATRVGGNPELVIEGHTGLLVPPQDPPALAGAILALLQDRGLALEMGRAGQQRARQSFSLERMASQTQLVYEGLLRDTTAILDSDGHEAEVA